MQKKILSSVIGLVFLFAMILLAGSVSADFQVVTQPNNTEYSTTWTQGIYAVDGTNFTDTSNIYDGDINTFSYISGDGIIVDEVRDNLLSLYYDVPLNANLSESFFQLILPCQAFNISLEKASLNGTQIKIGIEVFLQNTEGSIYPYLYSNTFADGSEVSFGNYSALSEYCQVIGGSLEEAINNTRIFDVTVYYSVPSVVEVTNDEGNLIQGSGNLYATMKSSGSGLGKFIGYMTSALPLFLIGVGFIGIIVLVGFAMVSAIKNLMNKVSK